MASLVPSSDGLDNAAVSGASATGSNHNCIRFSALLRRVFPKHAAKLAAQAAGRTVRAAETWLADQASPSWDTVVAMAQRNDALRAEIIKALGGTEHGALARRDLSVDGTPVAEASRSVGAHRRLGTEAG